ncbi:2OG-Fe(II) oxygenase superfamily protein [Penicillium pulvis]|uniref:2OG-Fe(II) oxygenase superfamily protein n=1 Tax=Penicillium pulvis TaxID=1562058 RepID=UPI00254953DB|nr:2OG-Fe(II) oxygenase superfamily protein [Penicillium pulvis]KAJ5803465.1 2OG-Fe(II) oxygenase superfamily protein [Penicillium pulvis]
MIEQLLSRGRRGFAELRRYSDNLSLVKVTEEGKENDWAELEVLDISAFNNTREKEKLASQLNAAIQTYGFLYIVNPGLETAQVSQQFALAQAIFSLPLEEKNKYIDHESIPTLGYKPSGERAMSSGMTDHVEIYDDPKYNSFFREYPRPGPCIAQQAQTETFCRYLHSHVLYRLLVLTAIALDLKDEEALWKIHNFDAQSDCHLRYMIHHPRTAQEAEILRKETDDSDIIHRHRDFGTYTLLFSQPVAGLQVWVEKMGKWQWIKPLPGSIIVNVGECLEMLTNSFFKAPLHRVVVPPEDQRQLARLSTIYFTRPDEDTPVHVLDSPLISKASEEESKFRTIGDWQRNVEWVIGYSYS